MTGTPLRQSYREHVRRRSLEVARALAIAKGWDKVRVSEVAELVGTSRPSIYKEFGDKQGLGDAMVVEEAQRFLVGIQAVLDDHVDSAREGIAAAVRFALEEAAASPLLAAVLTAPRAGEPPRSGTGILPLLTTSASMLALASDRLVAYFGSHFPELDARDVVEGVDALIRLTVSHLVLPVGDAAESGRRISEVAIRYIRA